MGLKIVKDRRVWHIVSVYAPQQGCIEKDKEEFREKLEDYIERIPRTELMVPARDMNAHVGDMYDGFKGVHGGGGFGRRNVEGERFLELAEARNLIILNTQFVKRKNHLVTYRSGCNTTQIDGILVRKEDKDVVDCKVIPNESVVVQHKILVADLRSRPRKRRRTTERKRRIKAWELKNAKKIEFKNRVEKVLEEKYGNRMPEPVEEIW